MNRFSVAMLVGLAVVTIAATRSFALTPEEEAALRAEAEASREEARFIEARAAEGRDLAQQIFLAEFRKADGLEDQADTRKLQALQRWLQVGDKEETRAAALRETAHALLLGAYRSDVIALVVDEEAESERSRATFQRSAAEALLASSQDPETRAAAKQLQREADKDDRDAKALESQATRLRKEADSSTTRAEDLIQRAIALESAS